MAIFGKSALLSLGVLASVAFAAQAQTSGLASLPPNPAAAPPAAASPVAPSATMPGPNPGTASNAGMGATTEATQLDPEEVAGLISVNVIGAVNSVAAVLPEMAKRGSGQLVAVSSLSAYRGLRKSAAYCASKASLSSFFESLRIDLIGSGVDVTIIHPGFIKTPLTAGRKADMPFLMELDYAVNKIIGAIEKKKKSYAFPWQLATIVRAGMIMPSRNM